MRNLFCLFILILPTLSWSQAQETMTSPRYEQIKALYNNFNKNTPDLLKDFYDNDIEFYDSVGSIKGLQALTDYYMNLYENVKDIRFDFSHFIEKDDRIVVFWTMIYNVDKLNSGKPIEVKGNSDILFSKTSLKVIYHRDYFDVGAMVYEHVPVLGFFVRKIKGRLELSKNH